MSEINRHYLHADELPPNFLQRLENRLARKVMVFPEYFPQTEEVLSDQFQLLAEMLTTLRGKIEDDHEKAVIIHGYRCFNCCWSAYQIIKAGFLSEGATLAVSALESLWYIEYFNRKPHLASRWLNGTQYPLQVFWKTLPIEKREFYQTLKSYMDYSLLDVPRKLVEDVSSPSFRLGGIDEIKAQHSLIKLLSQLLQDMLRVFLETGDNNYGEKAQDYQKKLAGIDQLILRMEDFLHF